MTITEALAELKTVSKRIATKQSFILQYLSRQEGIKDPLERTGGSVKAIEAELQAINDLSERVVAIRRGIQNANEGTKITIEGTERTIADWIIWRREVAPSYGRLLDSLNTMLRNLRSDAQRKGQNVFGMNVNTADTKPQDVIVNIDEQDLATRREKQDSILGQLDGQLSLKNATVMVVI